MGLTDEPKIRRNSCLRHATCILFCLLLAMSFVNVDVCLIAFAMYLLNGVSFSIFVLIRDYCTPLGLDGFPNATFFCFPMLCCPFRLRKINKKDT